MMHASKRGESQTRSAVANRLQPVARFAWFVTAYNMAVILWGAYVRASGSGSGCGNRWPLCNGDLLPSTAQSQTIIEFVHRLMSAIALGLVSILFVWCWRRTSKGDWARYSGLGAVILLFNEAILGALLVLFDYVGLNRSLGHAVFLCLHFGNTLLLLAALVLTATWLSYERRPRLELVCRPRELALIAAGVLSVMAIGISGSVAALADTIFPPESLENALAQGLSASSHVLLRVRLLHPIGAIIGGAYIFWMLWRLSKTRGGSPWILATTATLVLQVGLGMSNVTLLAPIWLQLSHLLVAEVFWIVFVVGSAEMLFASRHSAAPAVGTGAGEVSRSFSEPAVTRSPSALRG